MHVQFQQETVFHLQFQQETPAVQPRFLSFRWFPEVQNIYYQGNKRKLVPSNQNSRRLEAFFTAASVLMTNQLQSLALLSIQDYTSLFCPPQVNT
jgi:dynein heavy chain